MRRREVLAALAGAAVASCRSSSPTRRERWGVGEPSVVFEHQPLWGDPAPFRALLAEFERKRGIRVVTEPLPNASDILHQFFLTALEGGTTDFDVFVIDVVWVPEFARAGWIADLSDTFAPDTLRRDLLAGAADAVVVDGRTFAVPWYLDAGLLYRRTDLVPDAPATYDELERAALAARAEGRVEHGYVWQGRQYEGLVCNAYEAIWGHGGQSMDGDRLLLDTPPAREGLEYLRGLVTRGVSPRTVTSQAEEEARRIFQDGRAAFMRNWPYAWTEAQREGSAVRGRVGISPLPTTSGQPGAGALGGYQLAVNARSAPEARAWATSLIEHLTSLDASVAMAIAYGRNPPRRAAYDDPRVVARAPQIAQLLPVVSSARPRPVTPYYPMISDALQGELSAALVGVRSPAAALARAQALVDHLMAEVP